MVKSLDGSSLIKKMNKFKLMNSIKNKNIITNQVKSVYENAKNIEKK